MGQSQSTQNPGNEPGKHYHDLANKEGRSQSTQNPGNEPGKHYRDLANKEGSIRWELSQRSQSAYKQNSGAEAKELSEIAKIHYAEMERYNALAAAEVFAAHNPSYLQPSTFGALIAFFSTPASLRQIDLHGLRVDEALEKVDDHLVLCRKYGVARTLVITGRGLHSVDGVAKIRPRVRQLLEEEGVTIVTKGRQNEGAFVVELGKGVGGLSLLWQVLFESVWWRFIGSCRAWWDGCFR